MCRNIREGHRYVPTRIDLSKFHCMLVWGIGLFANLTQLLRQVHWKSPRRVALLNDAWFDDITSFDEETR